MLARKEFGVTLGVGMEERCAVVHPLVTSQTTKHGWGDGSNIKT